MKVSLCRRCVPMRQKSKEEERPATCERQLSLTCLRAMLQEQQKKEEEERKRKEQEAAEEAARKEAEERRLAAEAAVEAERAAAEQKEAEERQRIEEQKSKELAQIQVAPASPWLHCALVAAHQRRLRILPVGPPLPRACQRQRWQLKASATHELSWISCSGRGPCFHDCTGVSTNTLPYNVSIYHTLGPLVHSQYERRPSALKPASFKRRAG